MTDRESTSIQDHSFHPSDRSAREATTAATTRAPAVDQVGLAHLVAVVERIRREWDSPGIRAAVETALARHPYAVVAVVTVNTTVDPKATTPAVILARCDNGWMATPPDAPPTTTRLPPRVSELRCPRCGLVNTEGDKHQCARRADRDTAHGYAEQARTAARAGRDELRAHEARRRERRADANGDEGDEADASEMLRMSPPPA